MGKISSEFTSVIPNMRNLQPDERLTASASNSDLIQAEIAALGGKNILPMHLANGMIENVVGKFELPLGVATNFMINGKDYLIPMAVEEPSVVAAASFMAKIARTCGGFNTSASDPVMRGQVQVLGVSDPHAARQRLLAQRKDLVAEANSKDKVLISLGGGCKDIEVHVFEETPVGPMVIVHLLVDVRDAMGANAVNSMAEMLAPHIETIAGGSVRLRILSNLADKRVVRASVHLSPQSLITDNLDGHDIAKGVVEACALALVDPYRATTHNKGIMNGIDPVVLATGNDWRAVEAGAHAYAARSGQYTSLTRWEIATDGGLSGSIELPMAVGLIGGATKTHPAAQAALKLMGVKTATELGEVIAAVGLAQNLGALRALATDGIQKGHMALHARNIAILAGAGGDDVERIAKVMAAKDDVSVDHAKQLLGE